MTIDSTSWEDIDLERVLFTRRLTLEPLRRSHANELFPEIADEGLYTYMDERPLADLEALRTRYEKLSTRWSPDRSQLWLNWACRDKANSKVVGYVQATVSENSPPLLAYVFVASGRGRGLAREGCASVARELFASYGADCIDATVDDDNLRSIRLLDALGFERISEDEPRKTSRGVVQELRFRLARPGLVAPSRRTAGC